MQNDQKQDAKLLQTIAGIQTTENDASLDVASGGAEGGGA